MTNPTRYYIVQDDDRPVVRSVPVTVRPTSATDATERRATPPTVAGARPRRRRVARLVRAAIGRGGRAR